MTTPRAITAIRRNFFTPETLRSPSLKKRLKPPLLSPVTDTVVILNPAAGSPESVQDLQERVESIARGCPIRVTSHAGEAEALARSDKSSRKPASRQSAVSVR